ncbi:MAG: flagellar hook-associated protein FlgK [candidate division KSB1 bacterium]|nr:flagellar hook-associated protein FlgK [candidate division KSB1 bacterium]
MVRISDLLNTARRGLHAQSHALHVASHNIANANTDGYSRQRVSMAPSEPLRTPAGMVGTGVDVTQIERLRESLWDWQLNAEYQELARWQARAMALQEIEVLINEPSETGLAAALEGFWDSWQTLANYPEEASARQQVREWGLRLAAAFNRVYRGLTTVQQSLDEQVGLLVNQVNDLGRQIAALNVQIAQAESSGVQANDFRDRRDLLINELSRLVDVQVIEMPSGMVNVTVGGETLVAGDKVRNIEVTTTTVQGVVVHSPRWGVNGREVLIRGGRIGGLLEMIHSVIPQYRTRLDTVATAVATEVNRVHQQGYAPDGSSGIPFFAPDTSGAGDIAVHPAILNSLNAIAASRDGTVGNGDIALEISRIKNQAVINQGTESINSFFRRIVAALGLDIQSATNTSENLEQFVQQLEMKRESVSGVSLDEEMADLIRFQRAYQASARLVAMVDELMQTVLNMV